VFSINIPPSVHICQKKNAVDGTNVRIGQLGLVILLTTKQAAERLGVSERRVRALIKEGKLHAHQLGREYAIEEAALKQVRTYGKAGRPPKPDRS
jgi:excisionase family DNA binding protein